MNFRKKHCFILIMATMLLFYPIGVVWCHGGPPPDPATLIEAWDQDGDGMISAEEFKGPAEHFTHMDADGDGYLTTDELEAGKPGPAGGFEKDDADNDGRVSAEEFSGGDDLFKRLDADGDGYITRDEARPTRGMGRPGQAPIDESD